jgi:CRP-like cAMP-binding protein
MYIVLSGTVLISKFIPGAGDEALAFLGRGDYFGEMALSDGQPRSAGARAHDDGATVLTIPRDVVDGILDVEKVSSLRLLRLLCSMVAQRLRESNGKLLGWYLLSAGRGS